ncbi:MAG TPA: hypothetical protein DCP90_00580 [Clostridiales bacterium]|nr:MAG: hypothetical protein A2Y22_00480 [Clostridiales bacterium GWD2_32_59]HAN09092.1 hypothetical protein [Clostridiales bacterium]
MDEKKEEEHKNTGEETVKKYVDLLDNTLETRNPKEKIKWINKTKDYLLSHSYIIQKYIENLDVREKYKVILKLKRFKEEEILKKETAEKDYTKVIFMFSLLLMLLMAVLGLTNKDELFIIYSFIVIIAFTMLLVSTTGYMYDVSGTRREIKNIENWLIELREEEELIKENNFLKQQGQENINDIDLLKKENKTFKQNNKKLEEEIEELKLKLSNYIK